jgi:hypothetical protein
MSRLGKLGLNWIFGLGLMGPKMSLTCEWRSAFEISWKHHMNDRQKSTPLQTNEFPKEIIYIPQQLPYIYTCRENHFIYILHKKLNHQGHGFPNLAFIHTFVVYFLTCLCFLLYFFCLLRYWSWSSKWKETSRSSSKMESQSLQPKPVSPVFMGRRQALQLGRNPLRHVWYCHQHKSVSL